MTLRCLWHHILSLIASTSLENPRIRFSLLLCSLWWVQIVGYVSACSSYSFVYICFSQYRNRYFPLRLNLTATFPVRAFENISNATDMRHAFPFKHYISLQFTCDPFYEQLQLKKGTWVSNHIFITMWNIDVSCYEFNGDSVKATLKPRHG